MEGTNIINGASAPAESKRERHLARLRKNHPEKKFEDDEEIYGQIGEDYDRYEEELGGLRDREKTLSDMFAADPRSAQFFVDMKDGKSPWASYIRLFGPELKDSLDDPKTAEQIAEAENDYVERVAKSRELDEEYERNIEATLEMLRGMQSEQGLDEETIDKAMSVLIGIVRDGVMGKFAQETVEMVMKGLNHDSDVANAQEEGEIAGRNAKITEHLRRPMQGDGIQALNGRNSSPAPQRNRMSVFDRAREAD